MRKDRAPKSLPQSDKIKVAEGASGREFPIAILNEVSKEFPFEINSVQIAASGAIFVVGWSDDRVSKLHQVRIQGQAWSKAVDHRHIGRHRRPDVEGSPITPQQRFFGFWLLTAHDRNLINGDKCSVELVLSNGATRSSEVPIEFITAEDLRTRFAKFWGDLQDTDRLPPMELTYLEHALKRPASASGAQVTMPMHNVESVVVAEEGGVFINGWIDDSSEKLEGVRVSDNERHVTFTASTLARTYRDDVQTALGIARRREFGFWSFAANETIQRRSNAVDLMMSNGARQRREVSVRSVDQTELRDIVLTYLASARHLGNPQLEAVASLESYVGAQIINFNLKISREIVARPYVERFGSRSKNYKGSIIVCLYGKAEFLFLQNALFSNRPGIEDYEFIYVCNSPELAEPLLRNARIASSAYGIDQTLVILPGNAGFGAANNAGVNFAQTGRVLIMNPDVFPFDQDWAVKHTDIVEQLPRKQTSIFGVPLYYDDGSLMHGGMYFAADRGISAERSAFKSTMFLRVEHYGKGAPPHTEKFTRSRPVPAITGAFMSFDRNWFETIGGFTEDYVFGHYEDADLCLKSLDRGISPWIHDVRLWHLEGKGSHRLPVHDGASVVNRWLFNKRWGATVVRDMLGQSPKLPAQEQKQALAFHQLLQRPGESLNGTRTKKKLVAKATSKIAAYESAEEPPAEKSEVELVFG